MDKKKPEKSDDNENKRPNNKPKYKRPNKRKPIPNKELSSSKCIKNGLELPPDSYYLKKVVELETLGCVWEVPNDISGESSIHFAKWYGDNDISNFYSIHRILYTFGSKLINISKEVLDIYPEAINLVDKILI